ncbi:hypothetical protein N7488_004437 [Penicillium malachiteum]|nr:hypothetical protein N7488_004437 [Penicillium malachiteum]
MNAIAFAPPMGPPQAPTRFLGLLSFDYVDVLEWEYEELKELVATEVLFEQTTLLGGFAGPNIDQESNGTSNMGNLSRFHLEIIHEMMNHMDFLTLERFSRTCNYARVAAANNPTYKLLIEHSAKLPELLMSTQHSLRMLKAELQFPNCRSCDTLTPYFYMPTCERLCRNCSEFDKNYWLVELLSTKYVFNLTTDDLRLLPVTCLKPSSYHAPHFPVARHGIAHLVPVKCAIERAVKRWGSMESMREAAEQLSPDRFADSPIPLTKSAPMPHYSATYVPTSLHLTPISQSNQ